MGKIRDAANENAENIVKDILDDIESRVSDIQTMLEGDVNDEELAEAKVMVTELRDDLY